MSVAGAVGSKGSPPGGGALGGVVRRPPAIGFGVGDRQGRRVPIDDLWSEEALCRLTLSLQAADIGGAEGVAIVGTRAGKGRAEGEGQPLPPLALAEGT